MIKIIMKSILLKYKNIFFSAYPSKKGIMSFVQYSQCKSTADYFGFKRERTYTKVIDLSNEIQSIFNNFKKNTRYEINKANKMGITSSLQENLDGFVQFYNAFAKSKKRPAINLSYLESYGANLVVTKVSHNDDELVMHAYLVDLEEKRARLLHSASLFRITNDNDTIKLIGMANRYLHFADMSLFKKINYRFYDLGGYDYEQKDNETVAINQFKDSFGGELILESNYISYPLYMYRFLRAVIKKYG